MSTNTEIFTMSNSSLSENNTTTVNINQTTPDGMLPNATTFPTTTTSLPTTFVIANLNSTPSSSESTTDYTTSATKADETTGHSIFQIICFVVCIINIVLFTSAIVFLIYRRRRKITATQHPVKPNPSPPKFNRNCRQSRQKTADEKTDHKQIDSEIYSNDAVDLNEDIYDDVGLRASNTRIQTNVTVSEGVKILQPYSGKLVKSQSQVQDYSQEVGVICPYAISPPGKDIRLGVTSSTNPEYWIIGLP